jgi:hypothetical protein
VTYREAGVAGDGGVIIVRDEGTGSLLNLISCVYLRHVACSAQPVRKHAKAAEFDLERYRRVFKFY